MTTLPAEEPNYDETKVPPYSLPDPLTTGEGKAVMDAATWTNVRRPEILRLFETSVYGRPYERPKEMSFAVVSSDKSAVGGLATRKNVRVQFTKDASGPGMTITLFVPNQAKRPVPVFVGLHLFDTKSEHPNTGESLAAKLKNTPANLPADLPGDHLLETILKRGYAVATLNAADFCPDSAQHYKEGVLSHFLSAGQSEPRPDQGRAISVWAWGLSRALDYFETDHDLDARRVAVVGHSRMGKTALWAAAQDTRFAMAISNESGCGGAALSKRIFGETVGLINRQFPHWFCANFQRFNEREAELPVDQHELIALIAPRPVYIASASEDRWADPRGEFLAALAAEPVYKLLGKSGLSVAELPPPNHPVGATIGYHLRSGLHALTDYDWMQYLLFADQHMASRKD